MMLVDEALFQSDRNGVYCVSLGLDARAAS